MKKTIVTAMLTAVMMTSFGAQAVNAAVIGNEGQEWAVSQDETAAQTANVQVGADVDSTFKVYIPKKVTLAKAEDSIHYEANYNVRVAEADIRPDQQLQISVPQEIVMVEATLGEAETKTLKNNLIDFDSLDLATVDKDTANATFSVKAYEPMNESGYKSDETMFTTGSWSGTGNFVVTLADK